MSISLEVIEERVFLDLVNKYSDDFDELNRRVEEHLIEYTNFSGDLYRLYDFVEEFELFDNCAVNEYMLHASYFSATVDQVLKSYQRLSTDERIVQKWSSFAERLENLNSSTKILFISF